MVLAAAVACWLRRWSSEPKSADLDPARERSPFITYPNPTPPQQPSRMLCRGIALRVSPPTCSRESHALILERLPFVSSLVIRSTSARSAAVSYKPPMLVTRVRFPACAYFLQARWHRQRRHIRIDRDDEISGPCELGVLNFRRPLEEVTRLQSFPPCSRAFCRSAAHAIRSGRHHNTQ